MPRSRVWLKLLWRGLGLCLALLGGLVQEAGADSLETPWRLWGGVGGGAGSDAVGAMGELVFQKGPHQLSARAVTLVDPYGDSDHPMGEIGLLYGRTAMSRHGHVSLSAGLAVTDTDMDSDKGMTLGFPMVAEGALRMLPFLGVGLQVFGNLNSKENYGGAALFLQLGYLNAAP